MLQDANVEQVYAGTEKLIRGDLTIRTEQDGRVTRVTSSPDSDFKISVVPTR